MQQSKSPENIPEKEDKKASEERTENKDTETAVHSNDNEKKSDIDSNTEIKDKE